jgi:hypothetical protein
MNRRKIQIAGLLSLLYLLGCSGNDAEIKKTSDYTGNEVTYELQPAATQYNISGSATFKERTDHTTDIVIKLTNTTSENAEFPVHLHLGDVSTDNAAVAALLEPVNDKAATSTTHLVKLSDESIVSFQDLKALNACIKIHLASTGEAKDVILAAGNIGEAVANGISNGRTKIGVCQSE